MLTKLEVAQRIGNRTDAEVIEINHLEDPDLRDYRVDIERINSLGFSAVQDLDEAIDEVVALARERARLAV